ncbi:hypothetical protein A176_005219 [Myxococcus hansupus]|uniref:NAD glycohydrolase translocation F5/8 type C domain-containing protein n=1 Tax=Pseudomyxococcus hansupus TaxID=1297742 RepID=A0A0H4XJ59_9BACT|nr:hypothetical protein [Myxococcus hansupus]AKQ68307.1 hypothetical protein A176_005219 [Myxococcus hansupus]
MMLLSLLLAAAPPLLLEPDAGTANRLHPRRVTASSFLENGWNTHEQNYLPLYIADEDPATAWVEGVKGRGEGESLEWWGPTLTKAKRYRLFLRNGYQKSAKLFRANARPRKVRFEPMVQGETGAQTTGTPLEVELKDVQGWQEVRLPVPAKVEGVRLTLVTTYPGSKYEDTCLSDLRVYVEGDDPYRPEAEAAAFEKVRAFAFERKQAAARTDTGSKVAWAPRFEEEFLWSQSRDWARETPVQVFARFPDEETHRAALAVARETAALFHKVDLQADASEARKSWTRVSSIDDGAQQALARTALSTVNDEGLIEAAGLFHLGDASFTEDDSAQERMQESLEEARANEAHATRSCIEACAKRNDGEAYGCQSECEYDPSVTATQKAVAESQQQFKSGEFVQGSTTEPTAVLRGLTRESGNREVHRTFRQSLVRYTGKKASAVLVSEDGGGILSVHVLEWAKVGGKERIASITSFRVVLGSLRVVRYRPAA